MGRTAQHLTAATVALLMLLSDAASRCASAATPRQQSLDEWRSLTAPTNPPPRVFTKGNQVRFYFQTPHQCRGVQRALGSASYSD